MHSQFKLTAAVLCFTATSLQCIQSSASVRCVSLISKPFKSYSATYGPNRLFETEKGLFTYSNRTTVRGLRVEVSQPLADFRRHQESRTQGKDEIIESMKTSLEAQSAFLKRFYPRREWSSEFSQNATSFDQLSKNLLRSKRSIVYDQSGKIVASGSLIYAPYFILTDTSKPSGKQETVLPWMHPDKIQGALDSSAAIDWSDSLLPVEHFFNRLFPRKVGVPQGVIKSKDGRELQVSIGALVEVASFAVDHKSNQREAAIEELYYEFLIGIYSSPFGASTRKSFNLKKQMNLSDSSDQVFYSYGDSVGQRMYRPYGFEADKTTGRHDFDVDWHPLFANRNMLNQFGKSKGLLDVVARAHEQITLKLQNPMTGVLDGLMMSESEEIPLMLETLSYTERFFEEDHPRLFKSFIHYSK